MAVNKSFVIKNGLEVNTKLILADANTNKVGIGSTGPRFELDVAGGIGATDFYLSGIGTFANELNVGTDGSVLTALGGAGSVGVGTAIPTYLLDVRSTTSTGTTALYVQGDVKITGDLGVDNTASVNNLRVIDTFNVISPGISTFGSSVTIDGITTITNTTDSTTYNNGALVIDGGLGVEKSVNIGGDLDVTGNVYIGGTTVTLRGTDVFIENKDIVLGYTTAITPNDDTANHAGIAIASTEGSPLVPFAASGINTLPDTYKQMMWFRSGTLGFSTDMFGFNYGVAVGTTSVADGIRLAVGSDVRITDDTINTVNLNVNGIVTSTSGIVTYYGDGQYLDLTNNFSTGIGISSEGVSVGTGITVIDFRGAGISTVTVGSGIGTIFVEGGGSGTVSISSIAPLSPENGDLWYSIDYGRTFVYYDEVTLGIGSTAVWVDAAPFNLGILDVDDLTVSNLTVTNGFVVSGVITAVDFNSTSDQNLKTNIQTVDNALDIVNDLRGVSFDWKENGKHSYGVIAQELEQVLPSLVSNTEIKTVNYNGIIGVLIEAVKELSEEVERLKNNK